MEPADGGLVGRTDSVVVVECLSPLVILSAAKYLRPHSIRSRWEMLRYAQHDKLSAVQSAFPSNKKNRL